MKKKLKATWFWLWNFFKILFFSIIKISLFSTITVIVTYSFVNSFFLKGGELKNIEKIYTIKNEDCYLKYKEEEFCKIENSLYSNVHLIKQAKTIEYNLNKDKKTDNLIIITDIEYFFISTFDKIDNLINTNELITKNLLISVFMLIFINMKNFIKKMIFILILYSSFNIRNINLLKIFFPDANFTSDLTSGSEIFSFDLINSLILLNLTVIILFCFYIIYSKMMKSNNQQSNKILFIYLFSLISSSVIPSYIASHINPSFINNNYFYIQAQYIEDKKKVLIKGIENKIAVPENLLSNPTGEYEGMDGKFYIKTNDTKYEFVEFKIEGEMLREGEQQKKYYKSIKDVDYMVFAKMNKKTESIKTEEKFISSFIILTLFLFMVSNYILISIYNLIKSNSYTLYHLNRLNLYTCEFKLTHRIKNLENKLNLNNIKAEDTKEEYLKIKKLIKDKTIKELYFSINNLENLIIEESNKIINYQHTNPQKSIDDIYIVYKIKIIFALIEKGNKRFKNKIETSRIIKELEKVSINEINLSILLDEKNKKEIISGLINDEKSLIKTLNIIEKFEKYNKYNKYIFPKLYMSSRTNDFTIEEYEKKYNFKKGEYKEEDLIPLFKYYGILYKKKLEDSIKK